ncbi:unnamed protein product [Medioppia subpectinata]|uniref:NADP-dependent oxidoreductase domain-containing protein n=1 Tax=Medioppia subpectinata TaxID=1979941 RepID=A0A7R9LA11_9ACAR|nr:unnamed protein product [Medioppia subpectinata]CAG2117183.1 unnamed protein product [Medioppia subpectinata]
MLSLNNGLKIPAIGLGTYLIKDRDVCKQIVTQSLRTGYRLIDTANAYQNEEYIGEVIENLHEFDTSDQGRGKCRTAVLESIAKLKTPYVDLVLIHWPGVRGLDQSDPKNSELRKGSYQDLEDLHSEGLIKSIGVSNYMIKHMEELLNHCKVLPTVNQVEFHPLLYQKELLEYCEGKGVVIQAYSSLGAVKGWQILSQNETLIKVAKKYERSVPQILLKWGLQHNVCVIPKTSRVENLKPNFELYDFEISKEDMALIDALNSNTRFCWDPNNIV